MINGFKVSQRGAGHLVSGLPNQDSADARTILPGCGPFPEGCLIAVTADGVGSCSNSAKGSSRAVSAALQFLTDALVKSVRIDDRMMNDLLYNSFVTAWNAVEDLSYDEEMPMPTYNTTLDAVVFNGSDLYFGHSGDGGIVVLFRDGTCEMITERHKGEEAGSVIPLLAGPVTWEFGKSEKSVASFAMMTDGVLDNVVDMPAFKNRVYFPFFREALTVPITGSDERKKAQKQWAALFASPEYREKVTDDITFLVGMESSAVEDLPEIAFDQEAWDRETEEVSSRIEHILYPKSDGKEAVISEGAENPAISESSGASVPGKTLLKTVSGRIADALTDTRVKTENKSAPQNK